jgi:hypothetical protein
MSTILPALAPRAEVIPISLSSYTRQCSGSTPSLLIAREYRSGAGFE